MMHRSHIWVLALLLVGVAASAQPRLRQPEMYIGAHAGALASMVYFSPSVEGISPLTVPITPNGGLVFRYAGHKVCGLQVEINYMLRGWHEHTTVTETAAAQEYLRRLHYIEVPFLTHLYFGGRHFRGFLNLGPQVGYCIADEAQGPLVETSAPQYRPIQNRFDWGLAGGLGVYYRTNRVGLFQLEVRFNYSLGGIFKTSKTDYFSQAGPMDLSLNLAYMWEIKRAQK